MKGYCLKCKQQAEIRNMKQVKTKNNRDAVSGICSKCTTKMFKFIPKVK